MKGRNIFYFFLGAVVVAIGLYGLSVGNLTTFTPGTPIRASEVNTNFSVLRTAIEALEAPVDTARLAERAVTPAKMADQGCPAGQALGGYNNGSPNCVAVQGGAGLTEVARDVTLTGNGTAASPLGLANGAVTGEKLGSGPFLMKASAQTEIELQKLNAGGAPQLRLSKAGSPESTWDIAVANNLNWLSFLHPSSPAAALSLQPDGRASFVSTGSPQLEVRENNPNASSQLRLSVRNGPFWDIVADDKLSFRRDATNLLGELEADGDLRIVGNGTVKAAARVFCGASPRVQQSFNHISDSAITITRDGNACVLNFGTGTNLSQRYFQTSSWVPAGASIGAQTVQCTFSGGIPEQLQCRVYGIPSGDVQDGYFMFSVF